VIASDPATQIGVAIAEGRAATSLSLKLFEKVAGSQVILSSRI
jgi:hypothetical protein